MRKSLSLIICTIMTIMLSTSLVNASDLSKQVKMGNSGLSQESIKYATSWDAENDVTKVVATLLVDENSIDEILSQTSGNPAPWAASHLSIFYFEMDPLLTTGAKYKKQNVWIGEGQNSTTLADGKKELDEKLDVEPISDATEYSTVWPYGVNVKYSRDNGTTWEDSPTIGDGTKSIKQDLIDILGLSNESELVYGVNYRFSMYDKYTALFGWEALDENNAVKADTREYISIDYVIEFPVAGKVNNQQVMFVTLDDAIASGSTDITINRDMLYTNDLEIPEGVTLRIKNGVTLEVENGHTFVNNGTVLGNVKVDDTVKEYFIAEVVVKGEGEAAFSLTDGTTTKYNVAAGEILTLVTNPDLGHFEKEISGVEDLNKHTEGVYTFTMPNKNVKISVVFNAIKYNVTLNETINGKLTVDKNSVPAGDFVTIDTVADTGYELIDLKVYDVVADDYITIENGQFIMPYNDVEIYAYFGLIDHRLILEYNDNGKIYADTTLANYGDVVALNIVPNKGYEVKEFTVINLYNGEKITVTDGKFTMPNSNVYVAAEFKLIDYVVTLNSTENGKVNTVETSANMGDVVTVNPTPEKGYYLKELAIVNLATKEKITLKDGKFTMPASNVEVNAVFEVIKYDVTTKTPSNGKITIDKNVVAPGEVVTLTTVANKGYLLKEVTVYDKTNSVKIAVKDGKFTMPSGDVEVTAVFNAIKYGVTTKTSENGKVTVDKNSASVGEVVTLNTVANKGYILKEVTVYDKTNNVEIAVKDGKFTMPVGDVEINATFVAEKTPATLDAINVYFVLGALSLLGLLTSLKKIKRFN